MNPPPPPNDLIRRRQNIMGARNPIDLRHFPLFPRLFENVFGILISPRPEDPMTNIIQQTLTQSSTPYKQVISEDAKKMLVEEVYHKPDDIEEPEECPIMQIPFEEGEKVIRLKCGHLFGADAIRHWLEKEKAICPVCRFKFSSQEVRESSAPMVAAAAAATTTITQPIHVATLNPPRPQPPTAAAAPVDATGHYMNEIPNILLARRMTAHEIDNLRTRRNPTLTDMVIAELEREREREDVMAALIQPPTPPDVALPYPSSIRVRRPTAPIPSTSIAQSNRTNRVNREDYAYNQLMVMHNSLGLMGDNRLQSIYDIGSHLPNPSDDELSLQLAIEASLEELNDGDDDGDDDIA